MSTLNRIANASTRARMICARYGRWCAALLYLLLFTLPVLPAHAAHVTVTIEGLSNDLQSAATSNLTLQQYVGRDVTEAEVRRFYSSAPNEIRTALEPYGYYDAHIDAQLKTTPEGFNAIFRVTPGDPIVVREAKVRVTGPGASYPAVATALRHFKPVVGQTLDQGLYEQSKTAVETALSSSGYLQEKLLTHKILITRGTHSATIDLEWDSGPRFKFGPVSFSKSQFPDTFIERYIPWKEGDYYSLDKVLAFQQALVSADYFSTVGVQPNLAAARDGVVPIEVTLQPAKRTIYTAGAYVSTDTGPGVRAGMERRWVNSRGHQAQLSVDYAEKLEQYLLTYKIPLAGPNNRSYNFGASYQDSDTSTSISRSDRLAFNETRQWLGFTRTLGVQYINSRFEIAGEWRSSSLVFGEGVLARREVDDPAFPRHGYSVVLTARAGPEGPLSLTHFAQVQVDLKRVFKPGRSQRLVVRTTLGAMTVGDFDDLPPELRFFAGGDLSVRGFNYQEIGETRTTLGLVDGKLVPVTGVIGGERLVVGSVEYQYFFLRNWGAAVFTDAGDAFFGNDFKWNVGSGVGVVWRSPVGMVRLDVAKPVSSPLPHTVRFHVQIGPDI